MAAANETPKSCDYDGAFTDLTKRREPSAIRTIMVRANDPGMLSLAGGMPNKKTFPVVGMAFDVTGPGLEEHGFAPKKRRIEISEADVRVALQYSLTTGLPRLTSWLEELQTRQHHPPALAAKRLKLCVTGGSQDALTKAFEMLSGPGKPLLVETPTYSGSLAHLHASGAPLVPVRTDEGGLVPEHLEAILAAWDQDKLGLPRPRTLYTVPTGCNPTGASLSVERRKRIYEIARRFDLIILEDDPYYFLEFPTDAGDYLSTPSFLSMDVDARVLRFDSFSKVLSAGVRLGFATGPGPLIDRICLHSQATTLHTSGLSQTMAIAVLEDWGHEGFLKHTRSVAQFYREQCQAMLTSLDTHLKGLAEWRAPAAGMFVWLRLNGVEDSFKLVSEKAASQKVLMVPGKPFVPVASPEIKAFVEKCASESGGSMVDNHSCVRAAFSVCSPAELEEALRRIGVVLRDQRQGSAL